MKKRISFLVVIGSLALMTACTNGRMTVANAHGNDKSTAGMKQIEPKGLCSLPDSADLKEFVGIWYLIDTVSYDEMSEYQKHIVDLCERGNPVLEHFFSPSCSWYCGGIIDTVVSSSAMKADKQSSYEGMNMHDWDILSAWVTPSSHYGIGESVTYTFPGDCPRITTVSILNGYTRDTNDWQDYSRVKRLMMYYDGKPYAILELQDTRDEQDFDVGILGYRNVDHPDDWTLRFEILEVYPGRKYRNTAITELYFDGIDVH